MSSRPTRRAATRRTVIVESSSDEEDIANITRRPADHGDDEVDFTPAPPASARKKSTQSGRRRTLNATATSAATAPASAVESTDSPAPTPAPAPKKRGRPKKSSIAPVALVTQPEPSGADEDPDQGVAVASTEMDQSTLAQPKKSTGGRKRKSAASSIPSRSATSVLPTPSPEPPSQQQQEQQQWRQQKQKRDEEEEKDEKDEDEEVKKEQRQGDQRTTVAPLADITVASVNAQQPEASQKGRPGPDDTVLAAVKPIKAMDTILEKPMDIVIKSRNMMTMPQPVAENTVPKARLVITYLILYNFKSYAGRQEVGPFHASFSSVVGPNGSGKSNVIDSLLFVFGFRASKMRQGKISALIHNSADHPNLDYCEVAVHFQEVMDLPGGGHEVIPDSKLVVSRKAFKNNSSQYYINDKSSNFTTVTTLLRDRGVDLDHKRFLILQGEVESIAQMKPKAGNEHEDGLLEYLEDIIGTSKFKTPIEESATEVEALNDVCLEKSGRVQHVEREKNSLEDKKEKALAYVRDENELASKQAALYQLYIAECEDNVTVIEEAVGQMKAQLDAEVEKHEGSKQTIKTLEKAHTKGNKEFEAHEKETQALVKEMAKFEQERVKFDEKRKFLADKRKKLEKAIATAEKSSAEASNTIDQCSEEIEQRGHDTTELEGRVKEEEAELTRIREGLKGKTQGLSDQIAANQKSLEPWKEKISQKQAGIAVAESELAVLKEKANAGAVALEEVEAKIASIEEGRAAKAEETKACQAEKAQLEKEAKKIEVELESLAQEEPKRRAQLSNARQKADEARSSLSATQTQGNVLSALMRMRESGRIEGFHGRLGNLGTIDAKYDVAISTACGALDNFVTDTVEAGQQCIEYLRRTNLGRANFMCLDKLRVREAAMAGIETPEGAPRLFDLVKSKEDRFRPAFYHALQDTLVAKDLAQANRIAYGARRWRVVTLDGELIDKSGTMSGGGTSKKRGLMSSKLVADTTKEAVAKMEAERDSLEQAFQEFQERQHGLETRLRQLRDQIPACGTRLQKIQLEAESTERNLADAQRRAKELAREHAGNGNGNNKSDDSRAAALGRETEKLQREVEKLHDETASVEEEIKALQDRIMEIGGEKLRAQRTKVDTLKEEVASQAEETSAAEVRKAKAEKQKAKLERDRAKATRELEAANAECEALEEEVQNQGDKAESFRSRVEEAKEAARGKKEELARVKEELDEKMAELNATRAVEIEMRNKLEENQKVLLENRRRLKHWEEKLSGLVLQNIEDLERGAEPRSGGDREATQDGGEGELAGAGDAAASDAEEEVEDDSEEGDSEDEDDDDDDISPSEDGDGDEELEAGREAKTPEAKTPKAKKPKKAKKAAPQRRPRQGPLELPHYTRDELADMDKETLKAEIAALEEKTQKASVDLGVLAEYRRRVEEYAARSSDLASAVGQRDTAKRRCDDLRRRRLEGFMEGFGTISLRLKEMYQMITMGGNAELELVDSLDPFSEGILFSVMPPKKSWKNISNLSGGEKTLSSLALVFALHHYKPTPLYVMDEIDAALDFRNVSIVANYIKERTKNAQFIVISLRNNMFELAARLVGVYKVNHMTKSVTIENKDYVINRTTNQPRQPHHQQQHGPPTTNMMVGATMTLR